MPPKDHDELAMLAKQRELLAHLLEIRQNVLQEGEALYEKWKSRISPERQRFHISARNLAYYLALRRNDLRDLQEGLRPLGLSSLGRLESQVMPTLDAVGATLALICGEKGPHIPQRPSIKDFRLGARLLDEQTRIVLGKTPRQRSVRMMVTLPSEAATDPHIVRAMLDRGMDVARINCAHDDADAWARMIANLRAAEEKTGLACKISMDLGGPKSRTAHVVQPKKALLRKGDTFVLTYDPPVKSKLHPVQAQCTLRAALDQAKVGQTVWLDDGKLGAIIRAHQPEGLLLEVTHARRDGYRLKDDKGVNFPNTDLKLSPLTDKDLQDLDFIAQHADMINYSFVQDAADVRLIQEELAKRQPTRLITLILKVETARALRNLPEMLIEAGGKQPVGVMIARGDLAVEIGFERLAEIQEEIMWLCEAAHVPVIWATQVLETLAKTGIPSRAEITDAAMAERAECVMLNKGEYILMAMETLNSVLVRMQAHQNKKTQRLRALRSW